MKPSLTWLDDIFSASTAAGFKEFQETKARAEQGHAKAQYNLGVKYANGRGVAKDEAEAVNWYRKAAEQGHAKAQYSLGVTYANGWGVVKDDAEAVNWYRKAAEQGHALAQDCLGSMYVIGRGVAKDVVVAYKWFLLAGAQGYETPREEISRIELDLTPSQRAEGQRLAREWKPQGKKP